MCKKKKPNKVLKGHFVLSIYSPFICDSCMSNNFCSVEEWVVIFSHVAVTWALAESLNPTRCVSSRLEGYACPALWFKVKTARLPEWEHVLWKQRVGPQHYLKCLTFLHSERSPCRNFLRRLLCFFFYSSLEDTFIVALEMRIQCSPAKAEHNMFQ